MPAEFSHYEILRELGRGGMGVVYLARDRRLDLNRLVALKVILAGAHAAPAEVQRFLIEMQAASRLQHPNIITVYDVGQEGDHPYYTMELARGGNLSSYLNGAPLPPQETAQLVETLARAVHYAHQQQVLHRDLKPGNVMLVDPSPARTNETTTPGNRLPLSHYVPKLGDFSLAKLMGTEGITGSLAVLGTACYMAPEQASGDSKAISPASDIYSLGAMLYELLTGRPPFRGTSVLDTMEQVRTLEPVPPRRFQCQLPRDLETICLKCLEKQPAKRYASALALAEDLQRYQKGEAILARPTPSWEHVVKWVRRQPMVAALVASLVLVTILGFGLVTWKWLDAAQARVEEEQQKHIAQDAERKVGRQLDFNRVALAEREWLAGNVGGTAALLDACQPSSRAWEWCRLKHLCQLDLGTLQGHSGWITAVACRNDGQQLASASADRTVRVWDTNTHQEVCSLPGHTAPVWGVAFSPDGSRLASAGDDRTVRIWTVADRRAVHVLEGHTDLVTSVAFSPKGNLVASSSTDGTVRVWDASSGQVQRVIPVEDGGAWSVAFSPDGRRLAAALGQVNQHGPGLVKVWETATGKQVLSLSGHTHLVSGVAFSPNGRRLASSSFDRTVRLWNTATGEELQTLRGHEDYVNAVAFSPDGQAVASASYDQTIRVWSAPERNTALSLEPDDDAPATVESPRPAVVILRGHTACATSVVFNPLQPHLISGSRDKTVRIWNPAGSGEVLTLAGRVGKGSIDLTPGARSFLSNEAGEVVGIGRIRTVREVLDVTVSPDSKHCLAVARVQDGFAAFTWDLAASRQVEEAPLMATVRGRVAALACSPVSGWYACALELPEETQLTLWRGPSRIPYFATGHDKGILSLVFSPSGEQLASAGAGNMVKVWEAATGRLLYSFPRHENGVCSMVYRPDGKVLATGDGQGIIRIWDLQTGTVRQRFKGHTRPITALAFSADGQRLASAAGEDLLVKIWDTEGYPLAREIGGHAADVRSMAFSPDGRRLATAGDDRTVILWDVATSQEVLTLRGQVEPVLRVAFSPDGRWLIAGCRDGCVRAWEALPLPR
jgi:WD40 repeat protein